jgi:uncharacterized membrane protein
MSRQKSLFKQLIKNLGWLLICLGFAGLLTWLTISYKDHHPSVSSEGSAWGNMGDALSVFVMEGIFLLLALIFWLALVFRSAGRSHNQLAYVVTHLLLLAIVVFFYIGLMFQFL